MKLIIGAFLLDLLLGDPQGFPHPVRWIGALISVLEARLNRDQSSQKKLYLGAGMVAIVLGIVYGVTKGLLIFAESLHPWVGTGVALLLAYTVLATRSLHQETDKVRRALDAGDLPRARKELSYLVSRDTEHLEEGEIVRGTLETIAENISDGVIAPLFYLFLGGVPLAMVYKAINTLDSMVGYKNDRYLYFGRAAAKLDDVANYIPARFSALMIALGALLIGQNGKRALETAIRDGRNHNSPNSGYPEAAAAGALGIRLGGNNYYFGEVVKKPYIGVAWEPLTKEKIPEMAKLLYATATVTIGLFALFTWMGGGF